MKAKKCVTCGHGKSHHFPPRCKANPSDRRPCAYTNCSVRCRDYAEPEERGVKLEQEAGK